MIDVLIIGAGINGTLIARELSKYECDVVVIDKENDVANATTMANSAIIHTGHDPKEGTLKATLNVRGHELMRQVCEELSCDYKEIGGFVIACSEEERKEVERLYNQALKRNIPCEIVERDTLLQYEKNCSDMVVCALYLPTTAIVTPWEIAIAAMEEAMDNGAKCILNEEVIDIKKENELFIVTTDKNTYKSRIVINCAGVYGDDIANLLYSVDFSIQARKGEYYVLDKSDTPIVNHVMYPIPSALGKGCLLVPTISNNILLGPTSTFNEKEDTSTTIEGLAYIKNQVSKLVKGIDYRQNIRVFAGNRATGSTTDFIVDRSEIAGFYLVCAIESPGLASSPAICERIVSFVIDDFGFKKKETTKKRRKTISLNKKTIDEKRELIQQDSRYGHIVCRCEGVSEAEIVDAIARNCGATTIKGVKKRVRPGMGRCQGGFCQPHVVSILARELNCLKEEVLYDKEKVLIHRKRLSDGND